MPKFTKTQLAIPSIIVLLAVAAGGAQLWGQHEAERRLDETFAHLPAGSAGHYDRLSFNLFTRTLRIDGLTVTRDGHPRLSVEEVVLHHLSGNGSIDNPYHASAVRLKQLQTWQGTRHATAAVVAAQNVAALAPGIPAPAGTPTWLDMPDNGTLLAAGSVTATQVTDDEGASLAAFSASGYYEGQLQQASASGFADKQGNQIASISASAVDLDGLDRIFDTGRYKADASAWPARHPLIGHAEIAGFASNNDGGTVTLDHLTIDDVSGRPFIASPTASNVKTNAFARDAASAIAIGDATLVGLHFANTGEQITGALNHLSLTGYLDGALGRMSISGLTIANHGATSATLGHFEMTGLTATQLLHQPPGDAVTDWIEAAGNGGVTLTAMTLSGASVMAPTGGMISLASLTETISDSTPVQTTLALKGLTIPAKTSPQLQELLAPLSVDPLVLSLNQQSSFDKATGDTTVKQAVLTAQGLGSISLSGQFSNVPHNLSQSDDPLAAIDQVGIGAFTLSFTNDTLVQRIMTMLAKQSGKTLAEIENGAKAGAPLMAAALVPSQADAADQISAFFAAPKTLTLTASPVAPVPLGAFNGNTLRAAQAALNLHLSAQ